MGENVENLKIFWKRGGDLVQLLHTINYWKRPHQGNHHTNSVPYSISTLEFFQKLRSIGIICNVCRLNFINKFNAVASFENLGANIFLYFFYQWKVFIIFHKILFSLLFPPSYNPLLVDIPAYFVDFFCFLRHPSLELLSPLENGGMWLNHNIFCFLQNSCQFGGSCFQIIC